MLISAVEDFATKTLAAVPGTFGKLQYVAGLRQGKDDYFHWGFARVHGEGTASLTIARAHSDLFNEVLRSPVKNLWEEIRTAADTSNSNVVQFVENLMAQKDLLIPKELKGGSTRHFNSVLLGLSGLASSLAERTDPTALQFQPPAQ
jgi:hypothetical protein